MPKAVGAVTAVVELSELFVAPLEPLGVEAGDGALQGCGALEGCGGALELEGLPGWLEGVLERTAGELLERWGCLVEGVVRAEEGEVEDFTDEPFPRAASAASELVELVGARDSVAVALPLEERTEPLAGVVGTFFAREAGLDVRDFVVAVILLAHRRSPAPGRFHGASRRMPAGTET